MLFVGIGPLDIKLPRGLEADGTAETIRQILMTRTAQLWFSSDLSVPVISINDNLKKLLKTANLNGKVQCGLETISGKLEKEKKGIGRLREERGLPTGDRVSRLLLVSNDGTQRFYRNTERLLQLHAPRLLCCMLDMDGNSLGSVVTGRDKQIKAILVEHKEIVAAILHTLLPDRGDR
jgi:hypothetical protein